MNWLVWRLYRKQIIFTGLAVLLYAAALIFAGNHAWSEFNHALSTGKIGSFSMPIVANMLPRPAIVVPVLFGMFWGAPLIAKEYAEGTHKFAWVQGVTRRKWLATKLAWLVGFGAFYAGIISVAVMWCDRAENALNFDRFNAIQFNMQGLAPVAYTIFAIVLGTFVGALLRSSVRSVAVTLVVSVMMFFGVATFVRPHYMQPITTSSGSNLYPGINPQENKIVPGAGAIWIIGTEEKLVSKNCEEVKGRPLCGSIVQTTKTVYQPASRYWAFQSIELGLYLGSSAVLAALSCRLIQKRDV
jgi:ABC-type transport system involved in multi-copper enzyme maturation permease subunit